MPDARAEVDSPPSEAEITRFHLPEYDFASALRISQDLGLRLPLAASLVRRGIEGPSAVASLIEGEPERDPFLLDKMESAVERIIRSVRAGELITVHGDYDADGVCATALLVECLREMGAEVDWYLPDRQGGGYGVSQESIEALIDRGTALMITVDCGIGSRNEVAELEAQGIRSVVTDHHEVPEQLPDCPLIHPGMGGYPFPGLCGAGTAYKLACALRSEAGIESDSGIDLVALATVADLVPLVDENRTLVRKGLNAMRTSPRVGMKALMETARVNPGEVDAGALGFRLAPRINAAGRLYRADAGVELMLSRDPARAAQIGVELDRANSERRAVEREVMNQAETARRELAPEQQAAPALVLAGEGWHSGVVGIVASRLVEKFWKPVVLIALDGGVGRGSGRSVPGYDLLSGIAAGGELLTRFGGHKMAAGLEIDESQIDRFRELFVQHATDSFGPEGPARTTEIDAVIGAGGSGIDMALAQQLEGLEPFGMGNPRPRFLVPAATLRSVRNMGQDGKHAAFDLCSGSARVKGVGFGLAGEIEGLGEEAVDVEAEVEINRWGDSVEPRVVVRDISSLPDRPDDVDFGLEEPDDETWWRRFCGALDLPADDPGEEMGDRATGAERVEVDRRDSPIVPAVLDLSSAEGSLLVVSCDAYVRKGLVAAADPSRLGGERPVIVTGANSAPYDIDAEDRHTVFTDWETILQGPVIAAHFRHVAVVDPPWDETAMDRVRHSGSTDGDPGFIHLLWHTRDFSAAEAAMSLRWDLRPVAVGIWRALDEVDGQLGREGLIAALRAGSSAFVETPESKGLAMRALAEAGQVAVQGSGDDLRIARADGGAGLEESTTYLASRKRLEEMRASLERVEALRPDRIQAA